MPFKKRYRDLSALYEDADNKVVHGDPEEAKKLLADTKAAAAFYDAVESINMAELAKYQKAEKFYNRINQISKEANVNVADTINYIKHPASMKVDAKSNNAYIKGVISLAGTRISLLSSANTKMLNNYTKIVYSGAHRVNESYSGGVDMNIIMESENVFDSMYESRKESINEAVGAVIVGVLVWIVYIIACATVGFAIGWIIGSIIDKINAKKYEKAEQEYKDAWKDFDEEFRRAAEETSRMYEEYTKKTRASATETKNDVNVLKKQLIASCKREDEAGVLNGSNLENMSDEELKKKEQEIRNKTYGGKVKWRGPVQDVEYKDA